MARRRPTWREAIGLRLLGFRPGRVMETKQSATAPAILSLGPYQAKWMQSDYETFSREGYIGNPYVFACIRQICMAVAGIPWMVYKDDSKKILYDEHPYLALLKRPNPFMGGARFFENLIGFMLIDGNGYIERVGRDNGPPDELYAHRPDRMRVVPGDLKNMVGGYKYSVGNMEIDFPARNILQYKFFHPQNDWYGLSPIQAAAKSVDQSNQAKAWNVSLLQNGAQPTGAFVAPTVLEPQAYARVKDLIEERYAGFMNAGRPLLLEGGATWQEMGLSPADMSWLEGQKLSAREICMIFNIAPELIGDPEAKTFSNYQEARKALYEENILPLLDWIRDDLNNWLSPFYDGAIADYDKNAVEALRENQTATYLRNDGSFKAGWITINDARKSAGLDEDKEYGDLYKWQLPVAAAYNPPLNTYGIFDPNAAPPDLAPGMPHPELPMNHPLNQPPPLIPNEGEKDEPDTPSNAENPDSTGSAGGSETMGPAEEGKSLRTLSEAQFLRMVIFAIVHKGLETGDGATAIQQLEQLADATGNGHKKAMLPFLAAAAAVKEMQNGH